MTSYREAIATTRAHLRRADLRLLARLNTPWTLLGLEAWLDRHWEGSGRGVVILMPNAIGERRHWPRDQTEFLSRYPGLTCLPVDPFTRRSYRRQNIERALRAAGDAHYWLSARSPSRPTLNILAPRARDIPLLFDLGPRHVFANSNVSFHLLDEGYGNLLLDSTETELDDIRANVGTNATLRALLMRAEYLGRNAVEKLVLRNCEEHHHFLVTRDSRNHIQVNESIASAYRTVLARQPALIPIERDRAPIAMLLTDNLSELGIMTTDGELAMIADVLIRLKEAGFGTVLKPHPREDVTKFSRLRAALSEVSLQVLPGNLASEKLYKQLLPGDVLVGISNNALLTGSILYRMKVYSLDPLVKTYGGAPWFLDTLARCRQAFVHGLEAIDSLRNPLATSVVNES